MAKIQYQNLIFRDVARRMVDNANRIIEDYQAQGYTLTLRQLYYQFVALNLFETKYAWTGTRWVKDANGTDNATPNYDTLGNAVSNGRRAGLIDWEAIVDRTRYVRKPSTWDAPEDIVATCAKQFKVNMWENQEFYIEVWFEKDALLAVFERASEPLRLPHFSCRGYVSDSECWGAAQRLLEQQNNGKKIIILHFGDHDPSGIDMTRDITERLELFGAEFKLKRMALNMNQVRQYKPPSNPAKQTDSRFEDYRKKFGSLSWELDALKPDVLVKMVTQEVNTFVDDDKWDADEGCEREHRGTLKKIVDKWGKVETFVNKPDRKKKK